VGPNYDCSDGCRLVSVGIWLPRDAYQQEAFTQAVAVEAMLPGDLVFLISPESNSCGLYLERDFISIVLGRDGSQ